MGWNTSIVAIEGRSVKQIVAIMDIVFLTGETINAEQAFASSINGNVALAEVGGWCVVTQPGGGVVGNQGADLGLSYKTRAIGFLLSSTRARYAFRLWQHGREIRWICYENGVITEARGRPVPEEADIPMPSWGYDEDWVFTLLARFSDITWQMLESQQFAMASV